MSGRFPPLAPEAMSADQRRFAEDAGPATGGPYLAFLRSPQLHRALQPVRKHLRDQTAITPDLQELAILMVARHWRSTTEFASHVALAKSAGLSDEVIDAVARAERPEGLNPRQAAVHEFCRELLASGHAGDAAFNEVRDRFGEQAVVDLVGLVGFYSLIGLVLNVDGRTPPAPLPF